LLYISDREKPTSDRFKLGIYPTRRGNHGSERTETTKEQQKGTSEEPERKAPRQAGQGCQQKELLGVLG
jgi:hypothetical protein